jgi:hypothetical protein
VDRLRKEWSGGSDRNLGKIEPSAIQLWLEHYKSGSAFRNLHLAAVKDISGWVS